MKVFVAGATGVLGRALVPQLVAQGHEVVGMTRSASKQELLRSLGARPVVADALDPDAVAEAVAAAAPEVIVHQLTALSGQMSVREARHPDRSGAATMTNRLRTEATDHLLAAGRAVGTRRIVAQSFGAFRFGRTDRPVLTESDPIGPDDPPAALRTAQAGVPLPREGGDVDRVGRWAGAALRRVLRSGHRGEPGPRRECSRRPSASAGSRSSAMAAGSCRTCTSRTPPPRRRSPPSCAARRACTTSSTTSRRRSGEWLPALARALDAKPPRRIPRWLGRLAAGEAATAMMTEAKGASNVKARRELGWTPRYPSWRQGFAQGLGLTVTDEQVPGVAPVGVRHRVPDARQRERRRGRRAGGVPAPAPRTGGRRTDRVPPRLPFDRGLAARARPAALGPGQAGDVRGRVAARSRSWSSTDDDPAVPPAETADSLSLAFLVLLETLSPEQRAAFLLREVFDEPV